MRKPVAQCLWDFLGIPFRLLLCDQKWLPRLGWTTLEEERVNAVLPHVRGRLLDVGAGANTLVKRYGNGVGVDVFDWGGGALVVEDSSKLPFPDKEFDTVTFLACLNHIPYREAALREAHRLLRDDGLLLITMINPVLGYIGHKIFWWYSEDKVRGMQPGEVDGLWSSELTELCGRAGFDVVEHKTFVYGLNHLYVAQKTSDGA